MEIKDYIKIFRRRWVEISLIIFVVVTLHVVYISYMQVPRYEWSINIVISRSITELGVVTEEPFPFLFVPPESKIKYIKSTPVIAQAVRYVNELSQGEFTASNDELSRAISYSTSDNYQVAITARDIDPRKVVYMAYSTALAFKEYDLVRTQENVNSAIITVKEIIDKHKETVGRASQNIRDFIADSMTNDGIWSPEEQINSKLATVTRLEGEIAKLRHEINFKRHKLDLAYAKTGASGSRFMPAPIVPEGFSLQQSAFLLESDSGYLAYIRSIEVELVTLKEKYTDRHPLVVTKTAELNKIKSDPSAYYTSGNVSNMEQYSSQLETEISNDQYLLDSYLTELEDLSTKHPHFAAKLEDYQKLQRDLISAEDLYLSTQKRYDLLIERKSMEKPRVSIQGKNEGTEWLVTEGGTKLQSVGLSSIWLALLIGVLLGVAGGYFLEVINNTIRTTMDVKIYMNLPTLATLPDIKDESVFLLDAAIKSPIYELYNKLTLFLESLILQKKAKTLLFTSTKPEEGKTTISSNVAIVMAQGGEKVILVDCDLRKPRVHVMFSIDNSKGLSTLLSNDANLDSALSELKNVPVEDIRTFLKPTAVETLRILPSGPIPMNPVTLLKSERLFSVIEELKKHASIIIFDSPPVIGVVDSAILASMLDMTVIVVSESNVSRREAMYTKHTFEQVSANVCGVILNKVRVELDEYYYYYSKYRRSYK